MGQVGNLDPPRARVKWAVQSSHEAGIRVFMITSDQLSTAAAIARDIALRREEHDSKMRAPVGMLQDAQRRQLRQVGPRDADEYRHDVRVFSRAQPEDKIVIVQEMVGMTGWVVSNVPALKAADILVAMGLAVTDVVKGVACMVLLDDNFVTNRGRGGGRMHDLFESPQICLLPARHHRSRGHCVRFAGGECTPSTQSLRSLLSHLDAQTV